MRNSIDTERDVKNTDNLRGLGSCGGIVTKTRQEAMEFSKRRSTVGANSSKNY